MYRPDMLWMTPGHIVTMVTAYTHTQYTTHHTSHMHNIITHASLAYKGEYARYIAQK